ncbi:hypothetical protein M0Q97_09610 [Candidatus Dojkabacteria bacterium]|jgi:hypothetical protein|nr:hypothetical protein [Candidatus Dojkabacteria bacterium]
MGNLNQLPQKESIGDVLKKYKSMREEGTLPSPESVNSAPIEVKSTSIPPAASTFNAEQYQNTMSRETDPDLMTSYEIVKLPSKGLFYKDGISEVNIEYMTSKDEDLLTTPSLIENGTVLDILLKRKIKTKGIIPDDLLSGDRNAIILFLRSSSYGAEYSVQVPDPRTNILFKTTVDLLKLKYKKVSEEPDEQGYFTVKLPMRKKIVKFKLLNSGEETILVKKAEAMQEAYNQEYSEFSTLKLKSHIISIDEKTDRTYISKFVDAMPALDALTIRRKIIDVSPDVDMNYEFKTKDGYKFNAQLSVGIDFFFPST